MSWQSAGYLREFMEEAVRRLQSLVGCGLTRGERDISKDGGLEVGHLEVCIYQLKRVKSPRFTGQQQV